MKGRENAKERRRREKNTKALLKTARTFDVVLAHVRNGGTLISLCETWDVRYSDIIAWIRLDKKRSESYAEAGRDRSEWTREMVLAEIRAIGRPDMQKLIHQDGHNKGKLKNLAELDADSLRLIHSIDGKGKVKFYDRLKALELGARSEALLTDKSEHSLSKTLEQLIAESNAEPEPPVKAAS